jgi:serine/threonine protein kinase/Tfp pilus assembly protein PilF
MTPELWQRLKPLFHAALEEDTQNRAAFINSACGSDLELKMHLEQLIQAEQRKTGLLDAPLADLNGFLDERGSRFKPGELVLGRFRIIRAIGKGGMGEVYEAEDLQLGTIALKTIRHGIASSSDAFERFRQEVQLARRVSGPEVCRIHELYLLPASGKYEATAFLTMEYLDGITLYEKIKRDGPLQWKEAKNIALEICEGLRLIHENGIIHRDLKTGNIMLCKHGAISRVVLMDFGLARDFRADASEGDNSSSATKRPGKTLPQIIMGTPEYMAPEQFEAKPVSPATDIYALGIILYELVTGLHPYAADTPVAAAIRRARRPLSPSSFRSRIPGQCDRVIERCLEYDPEKRFQSAKEVAKALRAGPANIENLKKDRPWVLWFASAAVLGLVAGSIFYFWQTRQYYRPSPEALRWYNSGLVALREGNNVKATRSLQQAIAQDNHFVMAHARLAEAWANLDFDGNAQREFLLASPGGRHLEPLDRMYLDAIHATVTKDSPTEIATYRQILNRLPPDQKSSGQVDLGMAYERGGDPAHALESYNRAASLNGDNPAPFMHIAILQSRQHHVPEANRAFDRAQTLLTAEMNQEGLAELDFAHGYAANDSGNLAEAKPFLERSLDEARQIPSVQLQIRALTQLSSAALRSDTAQAAKYAEQAIRLARENQLDAWAADGLVRLADAEIHEGNLQQAESSVQEGLQLAHQTQQLRVEAFANLALANLMNQEHLPDRVIGPAQAALDYYKKNGYFKFAAGASLLLVRAQRDKGQYQQALQSGNAFLALATKSGSHLLMRQAEEVVGTVFFAMEQYPDALVHFENAKSLADTASDKAYGAVNFAETLSRLGRFAESDAMLQFEPVNDTLTILAAKVRTESLLGRGKYQEALLLAQQMPDRYPKMASGDQVEFERDRAIAESHLGMKLQALNDLSDLERKQETWKPGEESPRNLTIAEISLGAGLLQQAHDAAAKAAASFAATGQLDSELQSVCLAAAAAKRLKNVPEYNTYSAKAVDIVSQIQHTWSPQVSQTYLSRPDIQMLLREIPVVSRSDRSSS